jgi:hypothetical protein
MIWIMHIIISNVYVIVGKIREKIKMGSFFRYYLRKTPIQG